ncbi:ribonuclease P protein component [Pararhodobacter sp. SW119]|uniref:ribonuclease P protein component n=1 Tax=Pararhodobacter sp. SW119 TaxID=2780075 RepID=UPI001ADF70E9|nr:ribonuclease P protein component [Pararhodobacter sp. SW119]
MTPAQDERSAPVATSVPQTLLRRAEFLATARARRQPTAGFLLQARRREPDEAGTGIRVGFTASKKTGNAVTRNRAKRRLRAIARAVLPRLGHPGWDYVLVARPGATVSRDFTALLGDLERALASIHAPRPPRS